MSKHTPKFTPGPWVREGYCVYALTPHPKDGEPVNRFWLRVESASQQHEAGEAEKIANARLIAAAPDLLEALKSLLPFTEQADRERQRMNFGTEYNSAPHEGIALARAAIAKAEG